MRRLAFVGLLVLLLTGGVLLAQGGMLSYGAPVIGTLSAQSPLAFYTFNGTQGDLVTIHVAAITPGLDPTISLNGPTQQQLAISDSDPFGAVSTDARINYRLQATGLHTILVSSVNGATGDFLLRLNGQPAPESTDLSGELPVNAPVDQAVTQTFAVAGPATVNISSPTPDFGFNVQVLNANGAIVAILSGSNSQPVSTSLGAGNFTVQVAAAAAGTSGEIVVSLGDVPAATVPDPAATEEPAAPVTTAPGEVCTASSNSGQNVNIRSLPSTINVPVVGVLEAGQFVEVAGQYFDWYAVNLPEGIGWVFSGVVTLAGPCDNLPTIEPDTEPPTQAAPAQATPTFTATVTDAPATPLPQVTEPATTEEVNPQAPAQATLTATATATATVQQQAQSTSTYTPTLTSAPVQATATYTPSYTPTTPPAAQVAPEDPRFNNPLAIPLDTTVSVLDFVSYPGGDREDRVRYEVTGMNNNSALSGGRARLIIAVSCFGTGTQNIQFFTGGQTYSCGQTLVDREVTADSDTGSIVITAIGGQGTYVQWVLTGTATRIN